jgi:hypothetical protein
MMYTTEQLHAAIEQEVRPFMEERDHYFERCAQLEAALLRVQHGLEDRDWIENRSEMIDFIINTVHESRSQSEKRGVQVSMLKTQIGFCLKHDCVQATCPWCRIEQLEAALNGLYEDQVDYLTLNHLGGMDNHWMKAARAALGSSVETKGDGIPDDKREKQPENRSGKHE